MLPDWQLAVVLSDDRQRSAGRLAEPARQAASRRQHLAHPDVRRALGAAAARRRSWSGAAADRRRDAARRRGDGRAGRGDSSAGAAGEAGEHATAADGRPQAGCAAANPGGAGRADLLDPTTGRVLAMVGGFSFDQSQFNRATQAQRQPGSSFKPMVYLTALEAGISPNQMISNADGAHGRQRGMGAEELSRWTSADRRR